MLVLSETLKPNIENLYVLSRINDNESAAEVVQDVNILMAIRWVQRIWKDVTPSTVKRCFEKCRFCEGDDELMEDVDVDEEFSALVKELSSDVSPDKYVDFDAELATAEPGIKIDTGNSAFRQVVISDESEDEVEDDKNERGPNLRETLEMLDKIFQCPALDEKQVAMLGDFTQELENLRINEKKQTRIEHFFQKM